jgi:hypothetical protein
MMDARTDRTARGETNYRRDAMEIRMRLPGVQCLYTVASTNDCFDYICRLSVGPGRFETTPGQNVRFTFLGGKPRITVNGNEKERRKVVCSNLNRVPGACFALSTLFNKAEDTHRQWGRTERSRFAYSRLWVHQKRVRPARLDFRHGRTNRYISDGSVWLKKAGMDDFIACSTSFTTAHRESVVSIVSHDADICHARRYSIICRLRGEKFQRTS